MVAVEMNAAGALILMNVLGMVACHKGLDFDSSRRQRPVLEVTSCSVLNHVAVDTHSIDSQLLDTRACSRRCSVVRKTFSNIFRLAACTHSSWPAFLS